MIATLRDVKDHQKIIGYRLIETDGMTIANYPTQKVVKLLQLGHKVFNIKLYRGKVCSQNPDIKIRDFPALIHLNDGSYQVVDNKGQFVLVQRANKDILKLMRYDGEIFDFDRISAGFAFETGKLKLPNAQILDVKTEALNNQRFNCLTCMPYDGDRFPLDETDNDYEMKLHEKLQGIQAKYDDARKKEKEAEIKSDASIKDELTKVGQDKRVDSIADSEGINTLSNIDTFTKYWKVVRKSENQLILNGIKDEYKGLMMRSSNMNMTFAIPEGITIINDNAFRGMTLGTLICPTSLRSIQYGAFQDAKIKEIKFNDGLTQIYSYAFNCVQELKKIDIPDQVIGIGDQAFQDSSVEEVRLHGKLQSCGSKAFQDCFNLKSLYIDTPKCVYNFQCFAMNSKLENVEIKSFGQFKEECFVGCINLKEFIANCAGNLIGKLTLNECRGLKKVVIGPKIKKVEIQFLGVVSLNFQDELSKSKYQENTDVYLPQDVNGLDEYITYRDRSQGTFYYGVALRFLLCTIHVEQYSSTYNKLKKFELRTISKSFKFDTYNNYADKISDYKDQNTRGIVEDSIKRAQLLSKDPEELILRKIRQKTEYYKSIEEVDSALDLDVPKIDRQTWLSQGVDCPKALANREKIQSVFSYESWRDDKFTRFYYATAVNYLTKTFKNDAKILQILENEYLQVGFTNCGIRHVLKFQEYDEKNKVNEVFQVIEIQFRHRTLQHFLRITAIVDQEMKIRWAQLMPIKIDVPIQRSIPKDTISQIIYPGDIYDQVNNNTLNQTVVQGISMHTDAAYEIQVEVLRWIQNAQIMIQCDYEENTEYMILPIENIAYKLTRLQNRQLVGYRHSFNNCTYRVDSIKKLNDAKDNLGYGSDDKAWWKLDSTVLMQNKAYKEFNSVIKSNANTVKDSKLPVQKVTKIQGIMVKYFDVCRSQSQLSQLLTVSDWIELFDSELIEPIDQDTAEECLDKYRVPKCEYSLKIDNNQQLYVYVLIKQPRINRPQVRGDGTKQGIMYGGKELPSNYLYVLRFIDGTKIYGHSAYRVQDILITLCNLTHFGMNERQQSSLAHTDELYSLAMSGTFIRKDNSTNLVIRVQSKNAVIIGKSDIPLNRGYSRAIVFINPVNGCVYLGCQCRGNENHIVPFLPLKDLDSGIEFLRKLKTNSEYNAYNVINALQKYFSVKVALSIPAMIHDDDISTVRAAALAVMALQETDDKLKYRKNQGLDSSLYDAIAVRNCNTLISKEDALGIS